MKKIILLCSLLLTLVSFTPVGDCDILHNGTFVYTDDDGSPVVVIIDGKKHIERHQNNKYIVDSDIKWVSDCEYNATLVSATIPGFPFKKGTVLNVKVDKVEGSDIFYTGTIQSLSFKGKMTKISEDKAGK